MTDEKKKKLKETIEILKQLDLESLVLVSNGANMLKARQDLEKTA